MKFNQNIYDGFRKVKSLFGASAKPVLTLGLCCAAMLVWAGCASGQQQSDPHVDEHLHDGHKEHGARKHAGTHGTTQQQQQGEPAPAAAPAPEAPAPQPQRNVSNEGTLKTDLVTLQKVAPASVVLGETFEYNLNYLAHENLDSLVITDLPGDGLSVVKTEPAATGGDKLVWTMNDVSKGQSGTIKIWVKAEREGSVGNCATVVAVPKVCVTTFVGKAQINITKTGPAEAIIGSDVTYNIVVSNTGTMPAKNVVVTDVVPEGLAHASGQKNITVNVGELAPNQSKEIPITFKANTKGKHCNVVNVTTSNAGKAEAEACTTVLVPGIKIEKTTADKEQFFGRNARYTIKVSNTGDTPLNDVVVTDTAPANTTIVAAPGASVSGNTATWNVGTIPAGGDKTLNISLTSQVAGNHCNKATVTAAGNLTGSAEACTVWSGISALLLEKADNPDPIQIGETTTYTVKVTNQGSSDDTNVKVVVEFGPEIDPVSASHGGVVSGKKVTFPPFPRLASKQAFEYSIVAKGVQVGDSRVTFIRTSDEIPASTSAQESTRVY